MADIQIQYEKVSISASRIFCILAIVSGVLSLGLLLISYVTTALANGLADSEAIRVLSYLGSMYPLGFGITIFIILISIVLWMYPPWLWPVRFSKDIDVTTRDIYLSICSDWYKELAANCCRANVRGDYNRLPSIRSVSVKDGNLNLVLRLPNGITRSEYMKFMCEELGKHENISAVEPKLGQRTELTISAKRSDTRRVIGS